MSSPNNSIISNVREALDYLFGTLTKLTSQDININNPDFPDCKTVDEVFTFLKGILADHPDKSINTEPGMHGIRFYNEMLQYFNGEEWSDILIGNKSPPMPKLYYTGTYDYFESTHPTNSSPRFYAALLTSGTLTFDIDADVDIFLADGGKKGVQGGIGLGTAGGKGGDGGNSSNFYRQPILGQVPTNISIGKSNEITSFGVLKAFNTGGLGGAGATPTVAGKNGSSASIQPFDALVTPFKLMHFCNGAGGGAGLGPNGANNPTYGVGINGSPNGGGATTTANRYIAVSASANTGDGGGGGGASVGSTPADNSGLGGSGIILIRWGDWTE